MSKHVIKLKLIGVRSQYQHKIRLVKNKKDIILDTSQEASVNTADTAKMNCINMAASELSTCLKAMTRLQLNLQTYPINMILCQGIRHDYPTQNLFDLAWVFSRHIPMSHLIEIKPNICPYLTT